MVVVDTRVVERGTIVAACVVGARVVAAVVVGTRVVVGSTVVAACVVAAPRVVPTAHEPVQKTGSTK